MCEGFEVVSQKLDDIALLDLFELGRASKMTNVVMVFPRPSNILVIGIVVTRPPPSLKALLSSIRARGSSSEKGPLSRRVHPEALVEGLARGKHLARIARPKPAFWGTLTC